MNGSVGILNVGCGDTKLTFDKDDPAECARAARVVADMIKRGYVLMVRTDPSDPKKVERVRAFKEDTYEYIIADFDSAVAVEHDKQETDGHAEQTTAAGADAPAPQGRTRRPYKTKRLRATDVGAVAIAHTAGG